MENPAKTAVAYYETMNAKDVEGLKKFLHEEVVLVSPLAQVHGRESVLEAAKRFVTLFKNLAIRAQFGAGEQAMLALQLEGCPFGDFKAASLVSFKDQLIGRIELFYDARPFEQSRIFS